MSTDAQLYWGLGYCLFMLILTWILLRHTPEKINSFYGYRTPRSMRNQRTWDAANAYANRLMWRFSLYSFGFPVLGWLLWDRYNFLVTVLGHTSLLIMVIFFTERYLGQKFDKKGQPRKQ